MSGAATPPNWDALFKNPITRPTFAGGATFCANVQKFELTTPNEQTETNKTAITKSLARRKFNASNAAAPTDPAAANHSLTRNSDFAFFNK